MLERLLCDNDLSFGFSPLAAQITFNAHGAIGWLAVPVAGALLWKWFGLLRRSYLRAVRTPKRHERPIR